MLFRVRYMAPSGVVWPLMAEKHRGVFLEEGGLGSLFGRRPESVYQVVGRDGQRRKKAGRLLGFSSNLNVVVTASGGRTVGEVWSEWLESWPLDQPGTLTVEGTRVLSTPVRLSDDAGLGSFAEQPDESGFQKLSMPVVFDEGCWSYAETGEGDVTITNTGDSVVVPRVVWSGAGGIVVAPSGATFVLPPVKTEHVLVVDPAESYVVTAGGVVDRAVWVAVRGHARGGPVPVGGSARWIVPGGARLDWKVGVINPWR